MYMYNRCKGVNKIMNAKLEELQNTIRQLRNASPVEYDLIRKAFEEVDKVQDDAVEASIESAKEARADQVVIKVADDKWSACEELCKAHMREIVVSNKEIAGKLYRSGCYLWTIKDIVLSDRDKYWLEANGFKWNGEKEQYSNGHGWRSKSRGKGNEKAYGYERLLEQ